MNKSLLLSKQNMIYNAKLIGLRLYKFKSILMDLYIWFSFPEPKDFFDIKRPF